MGHSDSSPLNSIAADANDNNSCINTGQTCNLTTWNSQRRVHKLSNGFYLWDFAGNIWEWIKDLNSTAMGANSYLAILTDISNPLSVIIGGVSGTAKYHFGPLGNYSTLNTSPYGGLGLATLNTSNGAIIRGGTYFNGVSAGVFSAFLNVNPSSTGVDRVFGFRCVYNF